MRSCAHMPEFHSGIVAALLSSRELIQISACKQHDRELSMTSLIAVHGSKSPCRAYNFAKGVNKLMTRGTTLFNYLVITSLPLTEYVTIPTKSTVQPCSSKATSISLLLPTIHLQPVNRFFWFYIYMYHSFSCL